MSWMPSKVPLRPSSQTNVPDYEKMLQTPPYSSWGDTDENSHPVRSHSPPTHHYGNTEDTTLEPRIYQHTKYNIGPNVVHYEPPYREYKPNSQEGTVQYLSSDGFSKLEHNDYGYKTLPTYQRHSYRTLPIQSNPGDIVYRTPVKSFHDDRNLPPPGHRYVPREEQEESNLHPGGNLRHSTGDLRHWQQLHQEQLLHQQAPNDKPALILIDKINLFQQLSLQEEDSSRLESIKQATYDLIRNKDAEIQKYKNRVLQLEDDCSVNVTRLKRALTNKDDHSDSVHAGTMKELQYKYANLKTELNDTRSQKNREINELEIKLGAVEYELDQLKQSLKIKDRHSQLLHQLHEKEREVTEWEIKFREMKDSSVASKNKLDILNEYLRDLPSMEETTKNALESLRLKEGESLMKTKIQELERKLDHARKALINKEYQHRELTDNNHRLQDSIKNLSEENDKLKLDDTTAALFKAQEGLRDVREDKERLAIDLEKAKKLIERDHRKLRQQETKYQMDMRQFTERVRQEEEATELLREDISTKDELLNKLRKAVQDGSTQYQDLMKVNVILKEQLKHYEIKCTDEDFKLQRRFMQEMGLCFSELQSLVHFCSQRANGEDPNMSCLLGVRSEVFEENATGASHDDMTGQTIGQWTSKIKELRVEVDRLRAFISKRYAEDMADNINCTTQ